MEIRRFKNRTPVEVTAFSLVSRMQPDSQATCNVSKGNTVTILARSFLGEVDLRPRLVLPGSAAPAVLVFSGEGAD